MASGSSPASPALVPQKGAKRGRVIKSYISIENIMLALARETASERNIPLPPALQRSPYAPDHKSKDSRTWRPSLIVGRSLSGWIVLPMATFGGNAPDTWDLLLREIVVPVGVAADHYPVFQREDQFFAQTTPPWRHGDGLPTYLLLREITVPFSAEIKLVYSKANSRCLDRLELMTRACSTKLFRGYPMPEVESRLQSYVTRLEKLFSGISTTQTAAHDQDSATVGSLADEIESGGLSAAAPEFVPRWLHSDEDIGSFRYLITDAGNGTSLLSLSAVITSSRMQALRPLAAANAPDVQIVHRSTTSTSKLQPEEADKENVPLAPSL